MMNGSGSDQLGLDELDFDEGLGPGGDPDSFDELDRLSHCSGAPNRSASSVLSEGPGGFEKGSLDSLE
eukprot:8026920-Pyramimonas_sp.AAC.1